MKRPSAFSLSLASLSLALVLPAFAATPYQNGNMQDQNSSMQGQYGNMQGQNMHRPRGRHEAMQMVPARATLRETLNADKTRQGYEFHAVLASKVQLHNGPELPSGTVLMGRIGTDDMNVAGTSKLALRFTQARLKDGQVLPIKATIVGIYSPESTNAEGYPVTAGDQVPNSWNDGTLAVDQINAMPGIDLHSRIASRNSGVFVSNTKDDVKLHAGSELALAIAARHGRHMNGQNMNGQNANGQNPGGNQ